MYRTISLLALFINGKMQTSVVVRRGKPGGEYKSHNYPRSGLLGISESSIRRIREFVYSHPANGTELDFTNGSAWINLAYRKGE